MKSVLSEFNESLLALNHLFKIQIQFLLWF